MSSEPPKAVFTQDPDPSPDGDVLVVVFLRGGADGLNIVVPHGDDGYYRARPTIGISRSDLVDLDGFFGLHPLLRPLERHWTEGELALVHCVGSEDETRSHFEAQDLMEHAGLAAGGWLGRYLRLRPEAGESPLAAVALGATLPECLRGSPGAAAIGSIDDFSLGEGAAAFAEQMGRLYSLSPGRLGAAGSSALAALRRIEALTGTGRATSGAGRNAPAYGDDGFSRGLREIATLIKGRVGVLAACIDLGGWDSHLTQDAVINAPLQRLGTGLAAFASDLGPALRRTSIVVMSEFGRRLAENSALGTDHGRGGVMFVLGGGVKGGKVHALWPGLAPDALEGPGDLPVRTNYRDVLAPLLARHSPGVDLVRVFPGHHPEPLDL